MQAKNLLAEYYFEKYVLEVAIATLEKGGSVSKLNTYYFLPPSDDWKFPKYPSKTVILPPEINLLAEIRAFILANSSFLEESDCWLGTWINPQTNYFYFDIATCHSDFLEAKRMAHEFGMREGRKIVAIYNSKRNEVVYL